MRYAKIPNLGGAALTVLALGASPAPAAWPLEGVPLCSACVARASIVCSDGAGGAIVLWVDSRDGEDDLYAQRVTSAGEIPPGWPADGVAVCTNPRSQALNAPMPPAPDGFGGVIVVWEDYRNVVTGGTSLDLFAQRVRADGTIAPGWPVDGAPVTVAPGVQEQPVVLADGSGGAFIAWDDEADIYLQRLTGTGEPAPGWPTNGVAVCTDPGRQGAPLLVSDGAGGVFVAWGDLREGPIAVYAQRVTASGQIVAGWPVDGLRIVLNRYRRELLPDGEGGAYLSSATLRGFGDGEYYLQRITGAGAIAPGWPEGGALVCAAPDERHGIRMVSDGAGGALLTWHDYREFFDDEVYVQRLRPDGSLYPGWPVDGLRVTDNDTFDSGPDLAPDGASGAYVTWGRFVGDGDRVMVSRVTATGGIAPGWPMGGLQIPSDIPSGEARITAGGMGDAIVVWRRAVAADQRLRALRVGVDGPVPVLLSLVSAEALPGLVRLTGYVDGEASLIASVERRTESSDWERLGAVTADGSGRLTYEDRAVVAGTRYGYRLAYPEGAGTAFTIERWVTVPALQFALGSLAPNPSAGEAAIGFSLPGSEPAWLEVYDLGGRRVSSREVGALGAGTHRLPLGERGRLAAGVYTVRLRQGAHAASARAVVVR